MPNEKPTAAGRPGQTQPGISGTLRDQDATTVPYVPTGGCIGSPRPQRNSSQNGTSNGGPPTARRLSATHPNRGRRRQLRQQPLQQEGAPLARNWAFKDRERVERRLGGRGGLPVGPGDGAGVIVLTFVVPGPAPDPVSSPPSLAQLPRPSVLLPFSH